MEDEKLKNLAADLDMLIDTYGFGAEFSREDLSTHFRNEDELDFKMALLLENELIIKNQITGNYYFSNIVSCNMFLSQYLENESNDECNDRKIACKDSKLEIEGLIKKEELNKLIVIFEKDFEKLEITSKGKNYEVYLEINAEKEEFYRKIENCGLNFRKQIINTR